MRDAYAGELFPGCVIRSKSLRESQLRYLWVAFGYAFYAFLCITLGPERRGGRSVQAEVQPGRRNLLTSFLPYHPCLPFLPCLRPFRGRGGRARLRLPSPSESRRRGLRW